MSAPLSALSGVTLAAAAASAPLSINAAALAIGSFSGIGRSLLGVRTAERPVGCDARRRSCVGNALSINAAALALGSLGCTTACCSARATLIALSGVMLAEAAVSATLSIKLLLSIAEA